MDRLGEIITLLVYIFVSKKGYAFFYIHVLVHDHQCYTFIYSKDHAIVVLLQTVHKASFSSLVMSDLGDFWFIATTDKHIFDFGVILHTDNFGGRGIFSQRIANVLGGSNIVNDRRGGEVMAKVGPFWRGDFFATNRGLLVTLSTALIWQ